MLKRIWKSISELNSLKKTFILPFAVSRPLTLRIVKGLIFCLNYYIL